LLKNCIGHNRSSAERAAGATNIILREAIGIGQSISRRAWVFSRSAAARLGSMRSAELAHWPHPMVFLWQDFSRLSPRLGAAKISHNFDFLMKS
jgi:hypothetical protein